VSFFPFSVLFYCTGLGSTACPGYSKAVPHRNLPKEAHLFMRQNSKHLEQNEVTAICLSRQMDKLQQVVLMIKLS